MSIRFRIGATFVLAALCVLPASNRAAYATDKDSSRDPGKYVMSISSNDASANETLIGPNGEAIQWNMASRLDLYQNIYGQRSARCFDTASTSQTIYMLWIDSAEFWVDGNKVNFFTNFNKDKWWVSSYQWMTGNQFGMEGVTHFACYGVNHSAQVTSGGPIYRRTSSAVTNW
jgi:hypothetical protein